MRAALVLVPRAERPRARIAAGRTADDLWMWGRTVGGRFDRRLAERLAAAVAAIGPGLDEPKLSLLARYSLWTVLLDDTVDAPGVGDAALDSLVERICAVASAVQPPSSVVEPPSSVVEPPCDPLAAGLAGLLAGFREADPAGALYGRLTASLCDAVRAGVDDTRRSRAVQSGQMRRPSMTEYLDLAGRHVNYRSFAYGLVLLLADRAASAPADPVLDRLDEALGPACVAVRLANDLSSVQRDRVERRLNVLSLRDEDGADVTVTAVRREIEFRRHRHDRLLRRLATPPMRPCAPAPALAVPALVVPALVVPALVHSLRVALGVYSVADLR